MAHDGVGMDGFVLVTGMIEVAVGEEVVVGGGLMEELLDWIGKVK